MQRVNLQMCFLFACVGLLIVNANTFAQNVNIPDENLRDAILASLNKSEGVPITIEEMETLVNFIAQDKEIKDLTGLEFATNLQVLDLEKNVINDISVLSGLNKLSNLQLGENAITDISVLADKITLETLSIDNNSISDLRPLMGLINLENLNISNNVIIDLSPLSGLIRLVNITMSNNPTADLTPLEGLISLRNFHSWGTPILDLDPLASLPKLRKIDICGGEISDLSPLEGLTGLRELYLVNNDVRDISPIATLTGLIRLSLKQNEVTDVSSLAGLSGLTFIDLEDNEILDFSPLNTLAKQGTFINRTNNPGFISDPPKIEGPWLWVIVPTGDLPGSEAAGSGTDYLERATDGALTEENIATQGAVEGASVGNKSWKIGELDRQGGNNINELVNEIGLGIDDINHHVAYGSIILESPQEQQTRLHVGSGDAVKVWLNGELVHENVIDRDAEDYQDPPINITLNKGDNYLLVAVYEGKGWWSGFFGLDPATEFEVRIPNYYLLEPHPADINGDGKVSILDLIEVAFYFDRELKPQFSSVDLNNDGVINISDLIQVAQHIDLQRDNESSAAPFITIVQNWIKLAWEGYDGTIEFQKGITNLEKLLNLLKSKPTAKKTLLFANYPNPFNPETWIPYQLAKPTDVIVTIHSATGSVVRTIALGYQDEGIYISQNRAVHWDGKNESGEQVSSGIFFYTLTAGDFTATRKMLILK